jgi:hypothetical protein
MRIWFRRKEKKEELKLDEEINKIKNAFQPIVLSTLQQTQEY